MHPRWKDGLVAFATVNLLFFRRWAQVLPGGHEYFLEAPRPAAEYLSLMAVIVALSAIAWAAAVLARRSGHRFAIRAVRIVFVLAAALGVRSVFVEGWVFLGRPELVAWFELVPWLGIAAGLGYLQWRHRGWHRKLMPFVVGTIVLFSPLVPIMFAQGLYHTAMVGPATERYAAEPTPILDPSPAKNRVVWIIFDEMDQRLSFEDRPPGFALPEFERLRNESLYATHAYAPNAVTLRSMPSMLTGRLVDVSQPHGIADNTLTFRGEDEPVEWRDVETLFDRVREAGNDVAVVGTYHPFCRLFEGVLSACHFEGHYTGPGDWSDRVGGNLYGATRVLPEIMMQRLFWETLAPSGIKEDISIRRQLREIATHEGLLAPALAFAQDPAIELAFLHFNGPHPTGMRGASRGFYDADTQALATGAALSYFDNLVLADRTLGQMRAVMEAAGVWDNTTVIVTADHGYRANLWKESTSTRPFGDLLHTPTDHRVVFLLKPAHGGGNATQLDAPFNLVMMPGIVETALAGGMDTPEAAAAWIEANRTFGAAPPYEVR